MKSGVECGRLAAGVLNPFDAGRAATDLGEEGAVVTTQTHLRSNSDSSNVGEAGEAVPGEMGQPTSRSGSTRSATISNSGPNSKLPAKLLLHSGSVGGGGGGRANSGEAGATVRALPTPVVPTQPLESPFSGGSHRHPSREELRLEKFLALMSSSSLDLGACCTAFP
jgi:hypothetical protein